MQIVECGTRYYIKYNNEYYIGDHTWSKDFNLRYKWYNKEPLWMLDYYPHAQVIAEHYATD